MKASRFVGAQDAAGGRIRWKTSRRYGAVLRNDPQSRTDRYPGAPGDDDLACSQAVSSVSKRMRGGRQPNGRDGKPRRGQRPREQRLRVVLTATLGVTDAQSEQGSEVGPAGHEARDGDPEKSGNRQTPRRWWVNGRRAKGVERRYGWLGGRGSEG